MLDAVRIIESYIKNHKINPPNFKNYSCPDQYVGSFSVIKNKNKYKFQLMNDFIREPNFRRDISDCTHELEGKKVILILESPHVDEFSSFGPIGPANGVTGRNIINYLNSKLASLSFDSLIDFSGDDVSLFIMNAIQYQCSMGAPLNNKENRKIRDFLFRSIWVNGGEDSFLRRINKYTDHKTIVLNCVTRGQNMGKNAKKKINISGFLRKIVDAAIKKNPNNYLYCQLSHPASWHFGNK